MNKATQRDRHHFAFFTLVLFTSLSTQPVQGIETAPPAAEPPALVAKSSLSWQGIYDSNVFATRSDTIDDWINVIEPQLHMTRESPQITCEIDLGAELGRYSKQSRENYDDYWVSFDIRKPLGIRTRVFGGLEYSAEHEGRDSPDSDLSGISPTTLDTRSAQLGVLHKAEQLQLRFGGTYEDRRFDDIPSTGGTLINSDRDREHYGLGMRVNRELTAATSFFLQALYDRRDYRQNLDLDGFDRDSHGYRTAAGIKHRDDAGLQIEAYIGGLKQAYEDTRFSDTSAVDLGAQIAWQIRPATRFSAAVTRSLEETTEPGASGYLRSEIDLKLQQRQPGKITTQIDAYYGYLDYQGATRNEHVIGLGGTIKYPLSSNFSLAANYYWLYRDTDGVTETDPTAVRNLDYQRHTLSLTLTAQLP